MELAELVRQVRGAAPVRPVLTDGVRAALETGAATLADAGGAVYGLTTGVGALRDVDTAPGADQALRLWRSHAAAFGSELIDEEARATLLVRLHQLAAGPSGVSVALAEALEHAVLAGAIPVLHGYGSVGTGDLTVLAQLALALVGEGRWRTAAPPPVAPAATDGLPFLSSGAMTTGLAALAHADLAGLLAATERVAAVSHLALRGSAEAYDARLFPIDDPAGPVAARLSALLPRTRGARVQDPFSLRTLPQTHGVAQAALDAAGAAVRAELDHPAENPLPLDGAVLHHGRFQSQRLAAAFDALRQAAVAVATLTQARLAALVDLRLTGLPAFLASGPPGSSGVLILEYVAADLAARVHAAAHPAMPARTVLSLGLEETASHATQSVLAARTLATLWPDLLACELVAATTALRLAPDRVVPSPAADLACAALDALGAVPPEDHVLGDELRAAAALVAAWAD